MAVSSLAAIKALASRLVSLFS